MKRIYNHMLIEHCKENRQMAFITGPRQVGKTTTSRSLFNDHAYLNWDNQSNRQYILKGPDNVAAGLTLDQLQNKKVKIIFDELHKYSKWKSFLKGFFDTYEENSTIIVTGSARMNVFKRAGDSLMGRYFLYRMHPLSVRELINCKLVSSITQKPENLDTISFDNLMEYGGFPEASLKSDKRFYNKWKKLRTEQFFYDDLRDITQIQEIAQIEVLSQILKETSGQLINYSNLANHVNVAVDTIIRWISTLESMYYCFSIRPWFENVPKSLRKQPKIYLWDWSDIKLLGHKKENFIASHLLKAIHFWNDSGLGNFGLFFLRDKMKREVDFLITQDDFPWMLVEVKSSNKRSLSKSLKYFKEKLNVPHAFQVVFDMDYVDVDCFEIKRPVIVPAMTFLSQLV